MLSAGSPSKWPTQDPHSSGSSLLCSESEQTEDEAEMFCSEGSGSSVESVKRRAVRDERQTGNLSTSPVCTDQSSAAAKRVPTEGDLKFARKCSELHGYVRPLLELLNGLKTGRFEKGLSTYQQNVAMDRLQKILGVLQKPDLGEKYIGTLLQLEVMLKVWFPQVVPHQRDGSPSFHSRTAGLTPRWNQNQLHIPVKKRRLSLSDSDSQSSVSCKRFQEEERGRSFSDGGSWLSSSETTSSDLEDDSPVCASQTQTPSELPEHSSHDLLQQKTDSLNITKGRPPPLVIPPPATGGSRVGTQDCSVSSTTPTSDSPTDLGNDRKDPVCPTATQDHSESVKGEGSKNKLTANLIPQRHQAHNFSNFMK